MVHCLLNETLIWVAYSAVVDLYLAIYPATVLFKLQMSLKKKLAFSVALGIGSMSVSIQSIMTFLIPNKYIIVQR